MKTVRISSKSIFLTNKGFIHKVPVHVITKMAYSAHCQLRHQCNTEDSENEICDGNSNLCVSDEFCRDKMLEPLEV